MAEHYRADHVGSLLRPAALLEACAAHAAGRISLEQLRTIEDKAILEALEMQRQVGIDVCTDGEYRHSWWSGAIAARYVPIANLALSPQCGFASTAPGNLLTWDEQRRKLELVVQTARRVWG